MSNKVIVWAFALLMPAAASGQQAHQPARQHLARAEQLLERGQFVAALQEAQSAKTELPQASIPTDTLAAKVYLCIGKCHAALFRQPAAASCIDTALMLTGDAQTPLRFAIGLYSGKEQRIRDAMVFFNSPEGKNDRMIAEAHLALGRWHLRQNPSNPLPDALAEFQHSLALFQTLGQIASVSAAQCHFSTGYYFWKKEKDYEKAIEHFKKAEAIFLQKGGIENNYLAPLYVNMGGCCHDLGYARKAVELYEPALENFNTQDKDLEKLTGRPDVNVNLPSVYNNMGRARSDLGEFTLAVRYLEEAVKLSPKNGRYWNNLGDVYLNKQDWEHASACFEKALELLPPKDSVEIARPYHNLGIVYRNKKLPDKALEYELRALPYRKSGKNNELDVARSFVGVAECYVALKEYAKALPYLDSALWLQKKRIPSGLYSETSSAFLSKSECLFELGDHARAFNLIDSALFAGGYREGNFAEVLSPLEVLAALNQKGAFSYLLYQKKGDESDLAQSEKTYQTAAAAIRHFRNTLLENESKTIFSDQFRAIFSGGIEAALELHRLHPEDASHFQQAFALAEQSKALTLLEGVRSSGAQKFAGIPDSLLEREHRLARDIADTEILLKKFQEQGLADSDARLREAKDLLFQRQRASETFQRNLLTGGYANYYNYKYGIALAAPDDVRRKILKPGHCLVEYFIGDSNIFIFVLRPESFHVERVPANFPLEAWVDTLEHGLYGYHTATAPPRSLRVKCRNEYIRAASNLYAKIVAPMEKFLNGSKVVIVPDGALSYIPFEVLLRKKPDSLDRYDLYSYFGTNRVVSYCYSATLLRELREKSHTPPPIRSVLAFAPFFTGDTTLFAGTDTPGGLKDDASDPLLHSGEEVYKIAKMMHGKAWYGAEASRQKFVDSCHTARILHLSTHGLADTLTGEFAFLNFAPPGPGQKPERLFVKDLYTLSLKADLVVLSACQTGTGRLQGGEGVISIARAFALAGAKSIVTTLWSVREDSTKRLMLLFYAQLLDGLPYDEALARAKADFVRKGGEEAHPFFWAGFTGIGF